ncbi:DUF1932 domain-containing protein [Saccharopolyspora taberi]|uniref:NAD(P)-dependent oxidoreductase n=1 Tax=Saccharopolyspora taberi TaxID=60895 RepID=A0ABN3V226_9PSEU
MSTAGLLHPGEMGAAVGAEIRRNGHDVVWCPEGRSARSSRRAQDADLRAVGDLGTMLDQCDVVLSICPPAAAEDVAREVAEAGYRGIFVDANAISPQTLLRVADVVAVGGAEVVDASIIGPPPKPRRNRARLHLSGAPGHLDVVASLVSGTAVQPVRHGDRLGAASAVKMAFASFQKSSRVLAGLAHALADEHGVGEALLEEAELMSGRILAERDFVPNVAARAWRWGPEMAEVADTLRGAGLPPDLAESTAAVLARWHRDRDRGHLSTEDALTHLRT